ncbi:MAG: amidohydrolase family protein, partial [Candidatus Hodarchaeota archaeon]
MLTSSTKIFYNCVIYTVDEKNSQVDAMAVFKDKIIAIGTEQSVRNEVIRYFDDYKADFEDTLELEENDLGGACIVPGFIDAHMHPGYYIYYKTQLDLSNIKSYKELEYILKKEDKAKDPEDWIFGLDLMEDLFEDPA